MAPLRRALGRWDLTALCVNQVIGGSIFALPAALAATTGRWSVVLIAGVGLGSLLIAATFAEVGSRFDVTGGAYLYTREAFGRFPGFEVGWMQWFARVTTWAAIVNVLVASLGFYWPSVTSEPYRTTTICALVTALTTVNVLGIRLSAWVVNALAIGKLVPLVLFAVGGVLAMHPSWPRMGDPPGAGELSKGALLLVFGYGGFETVPIFAGEARDPRRDLPFALLMTMVTVVLLFASVQIVCLAALPGLRASKTPLADAAIVMFGAAGAAVVTCGAVVSTLGNNMGSSLTGSRALYALAEQGDVPRVLAFVSRRFGTPTVAILVTAAVSLVLAITGSFVIMAAASAVSRLVVYVASCAAALRLRTQPFAGSVGASGVRLPLGRAVPAAALLVSSALLFGATKAQLTGGAAALAVGAALYLGAALSSDRATGTSTPPSRTQSGTTDQSRTAEQKRS